MLTHCSKLHDSQQEEISGSTDEDMLENTKPNLISYSLSTSSSNHTTVSVETNSGLVDAETKRTIKCDEMDVEKLTSFEYLKELHENNMSAFDADRLFSSYTSTVASEECSVCSFEGVNGSSKLLDEVQNKSSILKVAKQRTSINNIKIIPYENVKKAVSMYNLHYVDDLQFTNHPRPSSQKESKYPSLTRSLSSITLKNRNSAYEHVQSKVKHYIKQLKNEKAEVSSSGRKLEVTNAPLLSEDSVVMKLQHEIKRLQNCLEEKDLLLKEVQTNHHSLLLQYGEAKNKLDQLRFTADRPLQEIKSVDSNFYSKVNKNVTCLLDPDNDGPSIVEPEFVCELHNQTDNKNNAVSKVNEEEKGLQGNLHHTHQSVEVSGVPHSDNEDNDSNELLLTNNICSSDVTMLKVSTWFTSLPRLPLPLPSCYGSLGSSASISIQQQDTHKPESELFKELPCPNFSNEYAVPLNIEQPQIVDCSRKSWIKNPSAKDEWQRDMDTTKGSETYFLPMDKCNCWTSQNKEHVIVEVGSGIADFPETLCVPPLNLEFSKGTTILHQDCNLPDDPHSSEDSLPSSSSSSTQNGTFFQKYSFNQVRVSDRTKGYLDTPTSYKSIMINCERARKATDTSSMPASSWETHTNRECELNIGSTDIKTNTKRNLKKNLQQSCCLKKLITSQRCWIDHTCRHYKKTSNRQMLRCEKCVSRVPARPSHSETQNVEQFLNNVSACAEDLKQRSEAIQIFLTSLVEAASNSQL